MHIIQSPPPPQVDYTPLPAILTIDDAIAAESYFATHALEDGAGEGYRAHT